MRGGDSERDDAALTMGIETSVTVRGTIYSFTCLQEVPEEFGPQSPYLVAIVDLDEGGRVTAQLTDLDGPVQIGDRVEMVTRKLTTDGARGMIVYGYKFRPLLKT